MRQKRGRPPIESSSIRFNRIIELMERENIANQKELANALGMSQQSFSRIMSTKKISEDVVQRILEIYPNYRAEWLLGYDEFPTEVEKQAYWGKSVLGAAQEEGNLLYSALWAYAELTGYKIIPPVLRSGMDVEQAVSSIKAGYQIEKDGVQISLSLKEMNDFENMLCDMAESAFKYLFKERRGDNG